MEIKNIKVRSQASKNYQVGEVEIEFTVNPGEEKQVIAQMQALVNKLAVEQVNSLCEANNNHPAPQTTGEFRNAANAQPATAQRIAVPGSTTYRPRTVTTSNYNPKPITDAQMRCLINYGYEESRIKQFTSKQASEIISQLKNNR